MSKATTPPLSPFFIDGQVNFGSTTACIAKLQQYEFYEKYNMSTMDTLLRHPAFRHRNRTKKQVEEESDDRMKHDMEEHDTFAQVRSSLSNVGVNGMYKYRLGRSKKVPQFGRIYDLKYRLMAYKQKSIRSVGLDGKVEIDQQSCHPKGFCRLYFETFGKDPITTTLLVTKKEAFYGRILEYYQLEDTKANRDVLKGILLAITYGGAISSFFKLKGSKENQREQQQKNARIIKHFKDQHGQWLVAPDIEMYKGEVKEMLDVVEERYPLVFAAVAKEGNNKHQNCTRALSYILQELETAASAMAVLYLIEHGLIEQVDGAYVMSFLHDGFYVNDSDHINDKLLVNLAAYIKQQVGLEVKFGFKRVDPEFTKEELLALKELPELLLEQKI